MIQDIIKKAEELRRETAIASVTPERVGSIMSETLRYMNEAQIFADALVHKIYPSEEAFIADTEHLSDLTGRPMKAGQLIYVYGPDALYRYDGGNSKTLLKEHALDAIPQLNELREALISLNDAKANTTGYYPQMSVGFADDLVGRGESVPAEFSFRASGGKSIKDGTARIKRLKGNSVVWNNQSGLRLVNQSSPITALPLGATFISGHKYLYTCKNKNDDIYIYHNIGEGNQILSHPREKDIFFFTSEITITANGNASAAGGVWIYQLGLSGATEYSAENIRITNLTQMFGAGNEPTTIEEFNARKPIVEDEYAYNEGEVIHMTAEGIKSVGDNAFDGVLEQGGFHDTTGVGVASAQTIRTANYIKVLPNETYHLQFTGRSLFFKGYFYDAELNYIGNSNFDFGATNKQFIVPSNAVFMKFRIYTTSGTITPEQAPEVMITLVHSGWKQDTDAGYQPYWEDRLIFDQRIKEEFPNGMKSAGTAYDVAYNNMNKGVGVTETRIEEVDMGTLSWAYDATYEGFFAGFPSSAPCKYEFNALCVSYPFKGVYSNVNDKESGYIYSNRIFIKDSAYTDAASFKAAMAGVMLYYELAEPTIIEYDEPFNLDYRVADFGTEQAIAEQPSAPISADIIYQFNAVDMIREHEIEIAELQSIITEQQSVIATMQAQLDSLISKNEEIK